MNLTPVDKNAQEFNAQGNYIYKHKTLKHSKQVQDSCRSVEAICDDSSSRFSEL